MRMKTLVVTAVLSTFTLTGCGYHFIGQGSEVLTSINAIAIPYFVNKSYQSGLEAVVTEAMVDEFVKSRTVPIVREDVADAVIRGVIEEFREFVVAIDKNDNALEYRTLLKLDVTLERKETGEVLWRNKRLIQFEDYLVSSDIAVTEMNKDQAILLSARELAERVHDSIVEGF